MELLRLEIKNNVTKVNKEIAAGVIFVNTGNTEKEGDSAQEEDEEVVVEDDEEEEVEVDEVPEQVDEKDQIQNKEIQATPKTIPQKIVQIKTQSKQITKNKNKLDTSQLTPD